MNKQINIRPRYVSFALWVFGLMLISACGDDEGKVVNPWRASDTLVFAYPYPGQQEVPTSGNVVFDASEYSWHAPRAGKRYHGSAAITRRMGRSA